MGRNGEKCPVIKEDSKKGRDEGKEGERDRKRQGGRKGLMRGE